MIYENGKKKKKDRGSILIGVIIVFILISSIAIAIINRSKHGALLTTDSRKGYSAYQASDSNVEQILNNIKKLDNDNSGAIPENTSASSVCGDQCYASDKSVLSSSNRVSEIFSVKKSGQVQSATRAVLVPILDRVVNPVSNLAVAGDSPNRCDAKLTWTSDNSLTGKISNLEVRKNLNSNQLSSDGWVSLSSSSSNVAYGSVNASIKNAEFTYGKTYSFSLKAKNSNPLTLDSLYYASPVSFAAPGGPACAPEVGQSVALGCLSYPAQSATRPSHYSCCEGTECYVCNNGWKADINGGLQCCTQTCPSSPPPCSCSECGTPVYTCTENKCSGKAENCDTSGCHPC